MGTGRDALDESDRAGPEVPAPGAEDLAAEQVTEVDQAEVDPAEVGTGTETTEADGTEAEGATAETEEDRWAAFAPAPQRRPGRARRWAGLLVRCAGHEWTLAVLGGLALAVLMTWPALRHPRYTLPHDLGDPTLVGWLLAWPGHILRSDPTQLWHANTFHPDRWSYAFTDSLLGYAPAGLIGSGMADAILRYNILFVLAHALAFIGAYALVRQLGGGRIGAVAAGLAFAYAPWRLAQGEHLQVLSTGGIALALAMLARGHGWSLRYGYRADRVRPGWIVAGWLVAAWQISLGFGIGLPFGYALALIGLVVAVGWMVRRVARRPRHQVGPVVATNLVGGTVLTAVVALMSLPYLAVLDQYPQAQRTLPEVAHFSPPVWGFFTAPPESRLWGSLHAAAREPFDVPAEMALLPGFTLLALALAGLFISVWSWRARLGLAVGVLALGALAMGPDLLDGWLYRPLFYWLPGWDALRTPGRLIVWITLLLGILAAGALAALGTRARDLAVVRGSATPGPLLRAVTVLPLVLVLAEGLGNVHYPVMPAQPVALASADGPLLVLPSDGETDRHATLWTTDRFPPLVNGAGAFTPTTLAEVREVTQSFPDPDSVSYLRSLGVETVVVLADRAVGTEWEPALFASGDGLGVAREEIGRSVVFHLNP